MTDLAPPAERLSEDRVLPAVVYGLYIASVVSFGGTAIVALIIAYARLADAGPRAFSHYRFAIRTFWLSIAWFLIGVSLIVFGLPLSLVLIGLPFFFLGQLILGVGGAWFLIRAVVGLI